MKTIRQIADEIGVSKQAVFKKIKREPLSTSLQGLTATVDGRLMVEVDGEKLIKQAFSENAPSTTDNRLTGAVDDLVDAPSTKNDEKTVAVDGVISVLQATIDTLQGQLEMKDRQIEQQAQTIPGSLMRWPQRSKQRQRPRPFTRGQFSSSSLLGRPERSSRVGSRNKSGVGLVGSFEAKGGSKWEIRYLSFWAFSYFFLL